jgi:penicillin-binding protein 1C
MGCLVRIGVFTLFVTVIIVLVAGTYGLIQYSSILRSLPDVENLRAHAAAFETTRILDRSGNVLYEILDPNAGRRTYVELKDISPYMVAATIATEDKGFYTHPGVDAFAILRAFWQNAQSGETISGASTITQQLARALLFSPEEAYEQTYRRKLREAILAIQITNYYTKDEILELYLNEFNYGNLTYGVQAAAEIYFRTSADKLTLGQAAFLAGLPQSPGVYDIYTNREVTLARMETVLYLMYLVSQEQGCIYVSNSVQPVCADELAVTNAATEINNYNFPSPNITINFPHWVNYIRTQLEAQFDPQTIYRSGFTVYTTLDPDLQNAAQKTLSDHIASLPEVHKVGSGAVVILHPATGQILAMVGSADFYKEAISGQVNMAIHPRQPGSAFKPLTYAATFEKGWTPATLIWDVPSEFPPSGDPADTRPPYIPVNYDSKFHGPVTVRYALGSSYNIPAVKALEFVGIYDNPATPAEDGLVAFARRLGITTLTENYYGLSLTLGGGEVSLLELSNAYAVFANSGRLMPPVSILKIEDHLGNVVYEYTQPPAEQVIRPEHAWLISSILSDNAARTPAFGANSVLNLPFQVAVKTGTTNDFRDNWTLGYTPDLVVGVWVGNPDFSPMENISGITGAGPIWAEVMQTAIHRYTNDNPTPFARPAGIVDYIICAVSGAEPSQWCPSQRNEVFAYNQLPLPKGQDLWQKATIDTWTGLLASPACADFTTDELALNVTDPWAIKWIRENAQGQAWAEQMGFDKPVFFTPQRACNEQDPRPILTFAYPQNGNTITDPILDIYVQAYATQGFKSFRLDIGIGEKPQQWLELMHSDSPFTQPERAYTLMLDELPLDDQKVISLRLYMESTARTYAETTIVLRLDLPTQTPTLTPTTTPTLTPTTTLIPPSTPTITPAPTETPEPTQTPTPTETP